MVAVIRWSLLAVPLFLVSLGWAQQPTPGAQEPREPTYDRRYPDPKLKATKADSLDKTLEEALKSSPDVRLAETKVREAEAELNKARMQVIQKVVTAKAAIARQKAEVAYVTKVFQNMEHLHKNGAVEAAVLEEAKRKLQAAKEKLDELQSEYDFLIGKKKWISMVVVDGYTLTDLRPLIDLKLENTALLVQMTKAHPVPGSVADKLRKALDERVSLDCKDRPLADVVKDFQDKHGVPFVVATKLLGEAKVNLNLKDVSFGAALEMLEDTLPHVHFAVRDYGVLVTSAERLPAGAVPMYSFWKAPAYEAKGAAATKATKAAEGDVEGLIKAIDEKTNLATINIGQKSGVAKGHTFYVYRLHPKPQYHGEIRILEVREDECVGRVTGKVSVGDKVSSNLSDTGK